MENKRKPMKRRKRPVGHLTCGSICIDTYLAVACHFVNHAINNKVCCFVTEAATNMTASASDLKARHTTCTAHALYLVMTKAPEQTQGLEDR